jgi:hypothetical protein
MQGFEGVSWTSLLTCLPNFFFAFLTWFISRHSVLIRELCTLIFVIFFLFWCHSYNKSCI